MTLGMPPPGPPPPPPPPPSGGFGPLRTGPKLITGGIGLGGEKLIVVGIFTPPPMLGINIEGIILLKLIHGNTIGGIGNLKSGKLKSGRIKSGTSGTSGTGISKGASGSGCVGSIALVLSIGV